MSTPRPSPAGVGLSRACALPRARASRRRRRPTSPTSISYSPAFAGTTMPSSTVTKLAWVSPAGTATETLLGPGREDAVAALDDEGHRRVEAARRRRPARAARGPRRRPSPRIEPSGCSSHSRANWLSEIWLAERRRVADAAVVVGPDGGAALDQADARAIRVPGLARRLFRNRGAAELEEIAQRVADPLRRGRARQRETRGAKERPGRRRCRAVLKTIIESSPLARRAAFSPLTAGRRTRPRSRSARPECRCLPPASGTR